MMPPRIEQMFNGLTFTKSASEIKEAAENKVISLKAKIEERQKRISDLRKEYEIDDQALIQLLTAARNQAQALQYSYSNSISASSGKMEEKIIGAGVVNNLLTENDYLESEKNQVKTLERISRNLKPIPRYSNNGWEIPAAEFVLSPQELEYLGF